MKQSDGITLIALIITIIVLLILAGVTIATLTGDNGVLTQEGNAKDKTAETEAIERVQVEVLGSYGTDGKIDIPTLNDNLRNNIQDLKYNEKSISEDIEGEGRNRIEYLPAIVTLNGYNIEINSNGGVEKISEIIAKIRKNPQAYYGKKVTNYKASDSDTNTYRIFYIDTENYFGDGANTIYLKADYSGSVACSTLYDTNETLVKKMNPLWATQRGNSESSWNTNEKAAAYLCSPVKGDNYTTTSLPWKGYYNSENVNYVIGGPSVEMYVKSYNQAYSGITNVNVYTLGVTYRDTNYPGYIYTLNGAQSTQTNSDYCTGNNSLNKTKYNSMYCGQNGKATGIWWLASPSACFPNFVCIVEGNYADLNYGSHDGEFGVSPLISLKSSFIPQVEE